MAITVSSRPDEYSNSAIFVTSTDIAEDSTHVNTRIEASLYVDGVVIAKKVKQKGVTTFDFTDMLKSKCLFTTPAIDDNSGTTIIDGGKTGSNLITGWTNDGFDTHTTIGANWTSLITNNNAKSYTNSIAVTLGKVYVLIFKATTCDSIYTVQTKTTPANSNVVSSLSTTKRMYIQPRTTGNIQLEFSVLSSGTTYNYAGNWEMYELNVNDWFCPYYISFTEKYEDASGVTQSGSTSTESQLGIFFKSNATLLSSYIIEDGSTLTTNGYNLSTTALSYPILKTVPSGCRTSVFTLGIINKIHYQVRTRIQPYNSSGGAETAVDSSLQDVYSPIIAAHYNQSIVSTYPRADFSFRDASVYINTPLRYDAVTPCYPSILHLIWQNQLGGFSQYTFMYQIEKYRGVDKEFYIDANKKEKVIPSSIITRNTITAYTPISVSEKQLEYIQDILEATTIYWQRAADDLVAVTVQSKDITIKQDNELTPFQIEITY